MVSVSGTPAVKEISVGNPRIAFLLGAGFMYGRLPLSVELAACLSKHLENHAEQDESFQERLLLYRYIEGAIRFQRGVLGQDPSTPINIEEIANSAQRIAERSRLPIAPYVSSWHPRLAQLAGSDSSKLLVFVAEIYEKLSEWLSLDTNADISYIEHLGSLVSRWDPLDIFTLNYDIGIELATGNASGGLGVTLTTGFDESGWNPTAFDKASGIRLHKLHGSMDWIDHDQLGLCSLQYPSHQHVDKIESDHRPLLIFGTDAKMSGREPFLSLLYRFSKTLSEIDLLISIGYGFADEYINDIITQRMATHTGLRLLIVAPDAHVLVDRFCNGVENPRVMAMSEKADEAIAKNLLTRRIDEIAREAGKDSPF